MINFASDYIAGAHPLVIEKLCNTNLEALPGYGTDKYCDSAIEKIKNAIGCQSADVFFLVGGTQTNQVVISTMLDNYEGVVAARTGHVSVHEAGAIEYSRHKVIEIDGVDGKLSAESVDKAISGFYADENHEHMTFPGMVYISFPTEYGTIYSKAELEALHKVCMNYQIPLYIDGARLGYGLSCKECDIKLEDLPKLCDVFYIGGTKVGALCGEAVVFTSGNTPKHFINQIKQHGALLAKGRLLGVQFDALFTDDLYMKISKHACDMAEELKNIFIEKGYRLFINSPTNQQFVILDDENLERLQKDVVVSFWEKYDDSHTVVRFATSWSTTEEDIEALKKLL